MIKNEDLTGRKFGRLTAIRRHNDYYWLCNCECGKEKIFYIYSLLEGSALSCGCLTKEKLSKAKIINLIGMRFGRLVVIEFKGIKKRRAYWKCKCDCGKEKIVSGNCLKTKSVQSCGCLREEFSRRGLNVGDSALNKLFGQYKRQAKNRNLSFEINKEEFIEITKKDCYYCGYKPNQIWHSPKLNGDYVYNGIDRLDNSVGYAKNNIVPCCKICNQAKHTMGLEEFIEWIKRVNEYYFNKKYLC